VKVTLTHVLAWTPPYVTDAPGWDLHEIADFEAYAPKDGTPVLYAPRDASLARLTLWAAGKLGAPVALEERKRLIWPPGRKLPRREPFYYVRQVTS
jgi:hypothetical protein